MNKKISITKQLIINKGLVENRNIVLGTVRAFNGILPSS
jgi:hypothetical protein